MTDDPTDCIICHRHATGLGIGDGKNPRWLCPECAPLADDIRRMKRLDGYELNAIGDAVEKVGEYVESIGKSELSEFTELEQRELIKRAVLSFGSSIRKQIREHRTPF